MKYSIYQIRLTNLERDVINGMENPHTDHPKFKAYHDAHAENFDKAKGFYEKVAEIEATDLENVFHVSNSGQSEENITRLAPMHSISVGDVIVDGAGVQYGVAGFGFDEVQNIV